MFSTVSHILYQLHRHRFLGWSLLRWLFLALGVYALLAGIPLAPGGRAGSAVVLGLMFLVVVLFLWARRTHFVRFRVTEKAGPAGESRALPPAPGEKIPIHVSGLVSVGKREQVVVDAPGHLECFRNGERAIVALVNPSRYLFLGALPAEQAGMWYAFIGPGRVLTVQVGEVATRGRRRPGLRVTFRENERTRVLYLGVADPGDLWRVYTALVTSQVQGDFPRA